MASHNSTCAVECFVRRLVCNLIVPPIFSAVRSTPNSWDNRGWRSLGVVESDDPAVQWILERSGPLHVLRVPLCPWPTNVLYDWPVIGNFTSSSLMWLQKIHCTVMGASLFFVPTSNVRCATDHHAMISNGRLPTYNANPLPAHAHTAASHHAN